MLAAKLEPMRQISFIVSLSLCAMGNSVLAADINDFESQEFQIKYFAELGGILLPVAGPIEVGSVIYSRDFSVEQSLSECLSESTESKEDLNLVKRTEVPSTWDSASNVQNGSATVKVGWSKFTLTFERQDTLASSEENPFHVLADTLIISNYGIRTFLKSECQSWFKRGSLDDYPEDEAPDFFVINNLLTWKGVATHNAALAIDGDASASFKVSDILSSLERLPWAHEILSRLNFEAELGAGQTTTTGKKVRHNISEDATSLTFLAFRPMYYDKSQKEKFRILIDEIRDEYYAATASAEQAAAFLEDQPDLSIRNGYMFTSIFPGPGEQRVYSEGIQSVDFGIENGDLAPLFFADLSQLVVINVMAGHLSGDHSL